MVRGHKALTIRWVIPYRAREWKDFLGLCFSSTLWLSCRRIEVKGLSNIGKALSLALLLCVRVGTIIHPEHTLLKM